MSDLKDNVVDFIKAHGFGHAPVELDLIAFTFGVDEEEVHETLQELADEDELPLHLINWEPEL